MKNYSKLEGKKYKLIVNSNKELNSFFPFFLTWFDSACYEWNLLSFIKS